MSARRRFIVRRATTKAEYVQAPAVRASWLEVRVPDGKPFAGLQVVKHAGWDHTALRVVGVSLYAEPDPHNEQRALVRPLTNVVDGYGRPKQTGFGKTVPNSGDGVRQVVRRLTDADLDALDDLDQRIVDAEAVVSELRRERKAALDSSWRRAKPVLVHELRPVDDKPTYLSE